MEGHAERAFVYRQRAEELRVIAADIKDEANHRILLRIAADYERLAVIQDQLASVKS
jgi:hypothetical protein